MPNALIMFIDIHRHSSSKGKADKVLRNLFHNETPEIANTDFCSVGLHPWHTEASTLKNNLCNVRLAAKEEKVIAIGEAGIDKAKSIDIDVQHQAFYEQIEIANEYNKPMIIHCVRAYDELQLFRKKSIHMKPWIIHWYNASPQTGFDLIEKGCYLSFGHMLFNESSKAFKTFMKIPTDRIFFETDDADINIDAVYKKAAELKGISLPVLQEQIKNNFYNCFGIKL